MRNCETTFSVVAYLYIDWDWAFSLHVFLALVPVHSAGVFFFIRSSHGHCVLGHSSLHSETVSSHHIIQLFDLGAYDSVSAFCYYGCCCCRLSFRKKICAAPHCGGNLWISIVSLENTHARTLMHTFYIAILLFGWLPEFASSRWFVFFSDFCARRSWTMGSISLQANPCVCAWCE